MNHSVIGSSQIILHSTLHQQRMRTPRFGDTGCPPAAVTAGPGDAFCQVITSQLPGLRILRAGCNILDCTAETALFRRPVTQP